MRKLLTLAILILVSISFVSAVDDSSVASMEISAYKDTGEQQTLPGKILKIEPLLSEVLYSSKYTPYDITSSASINNGTASLSNVMRITMGANTKANFSVDVEFTPFISAENGSKIPATYTFTTTADAKAAYQPGNSDPYSGTNSNRTQYQYEYTPSISITGSNVSGSSISVPVSGTQITILWKVNSARRRQRTGTFFSWRSWGNYSNYSLSNISEGATLEGVNSEEYYPVASATFNLSVSSFSSMDPNVDYIATIRVTVSGN